MLDNIRHCFVVFCRILSNFVESYVHCIQYIFPLYIAYNIYSLCILHTIYIPLLKSIQYFFLIHLTRYIDYALRTLFLITYIPYNCNYKHEKNYFFIFYLTYALKCAFLYTYFHPLVKH